MTERKLYDCLLTEELALCLNGSDYLFILFGYTIYSPATLFKQKDNRRYVNSMMICGEVYAKHYRIVCSGLVLFLMFTRLICILNAG